MMDTLWQIIQWALPAGGLGTVIGWLFSSKMRSARSAKEVHDIYKTMYADVSTHLETLSAKYNDVTEIVIELKDENASLRKAITRLANTINKANTCRYYDTCPIRDELRNCKEAFEPTVGGSGQHKAAKPRTHRVQARSPDHPPLGGSDAGQPADTEQPA